MAMFKIGLLGVLSQVYLFSCLSLNLKEDQVNSLEELRNEKEALTTGRIVSAQFDDDVTTLVLQHVDGHKMLVNLEQEGDCIYRGYLMESTTSRVLVTGCKGSRLAVQITSKELGNMIFTTQDGDVKPVEARREKRDSNPDAEYDYDYDDTVESDEFYFYYPELLFELDDAEAEFDPPPQKLVLNLNVYLDKDWYVKLGTLAGDKIAARILKHAAEFLADDSLDTKIELVYDAKKFYHSTQSLVASKEAINDLLPQELIGPNHDGEGHPTAHLYLSAQQNTTLIGKSILNGMCAEEKPRIIARVLEDPLRTAMTVAHEIGHLLGMEHDFKLGERGRKCGKGKQTGEFLMNYGDNRLLFSECSNNDFKEYYKRVVARKGKFCLAPGVVGCACNGRKDAQGLGGKCTAGPEGVWCYVHHDSGCADLFKFRGGFVSKLACAPNDCATTTTDCAWGEWSSWTRCSATCGGGSQYATRNVARHSTGGGEVCGGKPVKIQECGITECPTDCAWGEWSSWRSCSASCGGGTQLATRTVEQQARGGGEVCEGEPLKSQECGMKDCPIDCAWGEWSSWSSCSASCGGGTQTSSRNIEQQETAGGEECQGSKSRSQDCRMVDCPTDCAWGEWSEWSSCSVSCGGGIQYATRNMARQATGGGEQCEGRPLRDQQCGMTQCLSEHGSHCYRFYQEKLTWHDAKARCKQEGGDLTSIHSAEENQFLATISQNDYAWIGGNDLDTEGTFVWSDGSAWDFTQWGTGEPNNDAEQHCALTGYGGKAVWDDDQCTDKFSFICKKSICKNVTTY